MTVKKINFAGRKTLFLAVPLEIEVSRNKKFIMNMNKYRNAHWDLMSKAKANFNKMIEDFNLNDGTDGFPFQNPVKFTYKYYPKTGKSYDRMNVLSVVDKFTCDSLIKVGILIDDDYRRVLTPDFIHMRVDKQNPRMEIMINEVLED